MKLEALMCSAFNFGRCTHVLPCERLRQQCPLSLLPCPLSAAVNVAVAAAVPVALTLVIDAPVLVQVRDDQQLLQLLLVQGLANHLHGGLQLVARYEPIAIPIEYSAWWGKAINRGHQGVKRYDDAKHHTYLNAAIKSSVTSSASSTGLLSLLSSCECCSSRSAWILPTHCRNSASLIKPLPANRKSRVCAVEK